MVPAKATKCAHPVCSWVTSSGKYHSVECAAMERDAGHRLFVRIHRMQRQHAIHRFITVRDSISNSVKEKDT
jgi:hypothetical protein